MAKINWEDSAEYNFNKIRAFNPAPVAFTYLDNLPFKIYSAEVVDYCGEVGTVLRADNELIIACGKGALSLKNVQKSGGKPMNINDFLRGNKFVVGEKFI